MRFFLLNMGGVIDEPISTLSLLLSVILLVPAIYIFIHFFKKRLSRKINSHSVTDYPIYDSLDVFLQSKPILKNNDTKHQAIMPNSRNVPISYKVVIFLLVAILIYFPFDQIINL